MKWLKVVTICECKPNRADELVIYTYRYIYIYIYIYI